MLRGVSGLLKGVSVDKGGGVSSILKGLGGMFVVY